MKKRIFCLALLLCLLFCTVSLADYKKGSRGDGVTAMQLQLKELGFLEGEADGKFGSVTEKAVQAFHLWRWGAQGSGMMTDDDLFWLNAIHELAFGTETADEDVEPDTCAMPAYCYSDGENVSHCERHLEEQTLLYWLGYENAPLTLRRLLLTQLKYAWAEDIGSMYDEWALTAPEVAGEQRTLFYQSWAEQQEVWLEESAILFPTADVDSELSIDVDLLERETAWLEDIGVGLCFDLHGAERQT